MEKNPQRATVHRVTQQELGMTYKDLDPLLIEGEDEITDEHRRLRDDILKLVQKRGDIRRGDLAEISEWRGGEFIFDGAELKGMYWDHDDHCRIPPAFSFPEFPIRYWEGLCERDGFWVPISMIDYMRKHAYFGVPFDDANIQHNYLCTSFIHDEITYRVVYAIQPEDQREIALDNFRRAIKCCPLTLFDSDGVIQDSCLNDKNLIFLNEYASRSHEEAYPFIRVDEQGDPTKHGRIRFM